jgi:cytochrome c-type protein NapB
VTIVPKLLQLGAAIVVAVAAVGFLTGTRAPRGAVRGLAGARGKGAPSADAVPRYRDLADGRRGPNARMYAAAFRALVAALPALGAPVDPERSRRPEALALRAAGRAYDGAPPTIPHRVAASGASDCLACHARGAVIAERVAPAMSHPVFAACTQCHVPVAADAPFRNTPPVPSTTFVGLASEGAGERAWPGAPPTIPHPTRMRSECASCHGPSGKHGLRSTHPVRANCLQCHAQSAAFDQRPEEMVR